MAGKPVPLTKDGLAKLQHELEELVTVRRAEVAQRIHDEKELVGAQNAPEYEDARSEQAFVEGRIQEIELMLQNAVMIDDKKRDHQKVSLGSKVEVKDHKGKKAIYTIVGIAEADPSLDVDGWDAAAKAVILANTLMGGDLRIGDVTRQGITSITPAMIEQAKTAGSRWKLIASARKDGNRIEVSVQPTQVPLTDPLAFVGGGMNALTYETESIGPVTLMGAGAGGKATGFAVLSDLLKIARGSGL